MSNDRTHDEQVNAQVEAAAIWNVANTLRGTFTQERYKDVVIPFAIIRRLECAFLPYRDEFLAELPKYDNDAFRRLDNYESIIIDKLMKQPHGIRFFNRERMSLGECLVSGQRIQDALMRYVSGFSENVRSILENLEFDRVVAKLANGDALYRTVEKFADIDLSPERVDGTRMGYIFEELIRLGSETAEAGDHYTGRDIIRLMCALVMSEGCDDIKSGVPIVNILDQASGTGGMLTTAYEYIHGINPDAKIHLFAQEVNPESYAICKAELLLRGEDDENIRHANTFMSDEFPDTRMRFVLENPPFGTSWGGKDVSETQDRAVRDEADRPNGRWRFLPQTGDSQLLFVQSAISKLTDDGRAAIVENGTPLFFGDAGSGPALCREWLLEEDLLDAIIALPTDLFYNTGIATYIWLISRSKPEHRRGKVQLIDATEIYTKRMKANGDKKNDISPSDSERIVKLYTDFEETPESRIFNVDEFIYDEYDVMIPRHYSYAIDADLVDDAVSGNALKSVYDVATAAELADADELTDKQAKRLAELEDARPCYDAIVDALRATAADSIVTCDMKAFKKTLTDLVSSAADSVGYDQKKAKKCVNALIKAFTRRDESAPLTYEKDGSVSCEAVDTERINRSEDVDAYFEKNIKPYRPDAKLKLCEGKCGAEIPFTRIFYKYAIPRNTSDIITDLQNQEHDIDALMNELFGKEA